VLTCRQVSHLVSEAEDRRLGLLERWRLRVHLKVCEGCRNFQDHIQFMRRVARRHPILRDEDRDQE
jgi:putative zinc finger protein